MSHFTVLVVTDNTDDPEEHYANVADALQPFHEYECTGVKDEYVIWVDETDEKLEEYNNPDNTVEVVFHNGKILDTKYGDKCKQFFEKDDPDYVFSPTTFVLPENEGYELKEIPFNEMYATVQDWLRDWEGYQEEELNDGKIGRWTNPNCKWDWWVIGGRWGGLLLTKTGENVDYALKSDIDFESRITEARSVAEGKYDQIHQIINGRTWDTWEECREKYETVDEAREKYRSQDVIQDLSKIDGWLECDEFRLDKETYCNLKASDAVATFAVLMDGVWKERGSMGWFAVVFDESDTWNDDFLKILDSIPDDKMLTVVDCHI